MLKAENLKQATDSTQSANREDTTYQPVLGIFRNWILPMAVFVFGSYFLYLLVSFFSEGFSLQNTIFTNRESIYDSVSNLIELNVAILGVVLTVVAIVVQLAAQKYTPKLADLFLEDNVNRCFFVFLIFNLLLAILITYSIKNSFFPIYSAFFIVFFTMLQVGLLLPYFNYVFEFLSPDNIITSIQRKSVKILNKATQETKVSAIVKRQIEIKNILEQISDTALNSTTQEDRNMALIAINRLRDFLINYQNLKDNLPKEWFEVPSDFFINISNEFYAEILERRLWLDILVFMNMEGILKSSFRSMPDVTSAIAYNTRLIGIAAIKNEQEENINLAIEYFNTFLRLALNEKNQRVIFNLFYQYRLLTESLFENHREELAHKIIFYFKYYGKTAFDMGIWFIFMVSAYDISSLLTKAFDMKAKNFLNLIGLFFDDTFANTKHPIAQSGVRKAQLILAAYLFSKNADDIFLEKIVTFFSKNETYEVTIGLQEQLLNVKDKKFWEVTDRGINFEYMDEEQKKYLQKFFERYITTNKEKFLTK